MPEKIFYNSKGKVIGLFDGVVFQKRARKDRHFMYRLEAWGIEESVVQQLIDLDCQRIYIYDTQYAATWTVPLERFVRKGFVKNFDTPQRFLHQKFWKVIKNGNVLQEPQYDREDIQMNLL